MWGQKQQWISHKINIRHPWQLKKSKSWEPFWSYQLNSTANPAHLPQNWAKLAKLAVLFSQQLQKGSQDFDFFNCHGCRILILCEIHCYFCPHILWVYYFRLGQCAVYLHSLPHINFRDYRQFIFEVLPFICSKSCNFCSRRNQ